MILITNATGLIGRAVVRQLVAEQFDVRCLLRPSRREQRLPKGIPFSTISASLNDLPALRTAMQDVTAIFHLIEEESPEQERTLPGHAQDTASLIEAAREVGVHRFVYLSRLGADRASAYPLFRVRGEAEAVVRESDLDWTILQTAITYGPEDAFTNVLAMLTKVIPFILPIPETGLARFQPLWIADLVRCVLIALKRNDLTGQTTPLGGPEHFTLEQLVTQVTLALGVRRRLVRVRTPLAQFAIGLGDTFLPRNPAPPWWLDVLAVGSATELGVIPRHFDFEPCRFAQCLDYLRGRHPWRRNLVRFVLGYR
jgi:NADH dehydrogenase